MTINEAINRVDTLKPNGYGIEQKVQWLSDLDGIIKTELIDTHKGSEAVTFVGYDDNTPRDTVLLVPAPYDDIYRYYLEAQIDYANNEYGRYNNSMAMYNTAYAAYAKYYNSGHMPLGGKRFLF